MFRHPWLVRVFAFSFVIACTAFALAANEGQDDLDKATQLKIAAETLDDLAEVVEKLDSSIEKGLDKENEELAQQMLVSTLMQRGTMFATAVFNVPAADPQRNMRVMQLRSWALTDLQRALEIDDKLIDAHLQIGKLQLLPLGDNAAARRSFTKVIKAEEATPDQKAESYALRSTTQADDEKRLADLNDAVKAMPKKAEYLRVRGQYFYGKEKFDEALADIDKAIKLEDDHAATHELRGMILLGLKKYDDALASFNRASELEPDAVLPYQHRAEAYRQSGDLEKALEQLTKALELGPDNVPTLLIRSAVYYELKQTEKALEDVEQAIRVAPRLAQPYMMRAEIYAATDRLDEAISQLEELLTQAPGNVALLSRLGSFYLIAQRPRKAIETLSKVIEQEPENFNALRFRGDSHLNIGQHAEAAADFEKAIELEETDESLLNNYAWLLSTSPDDKVRNGEKAVELAKKAAELSGHQAPHILSTLGAAYAEAGDFENAKKWSQQAVDLSKKKVEKANNDEDRARLQKDLEQLEKELENYEETKPVRERQTMDDAPAKEKKKDEESKEDRLTPKASEEPAASESTAVF
jgi:tetratricopeptide (TPR) repeat protein